MRELPALFACRSARAVVGNAEITAVESGPAKARAAAATASACGHTRPDLVVDTGSCAGLDPDSAVGQVVLASVSYEYDIGGGGIPTKSLPAMKLPSAFAHLDGSQAEALQREAVQVGGSDGVAVRVGPQACGELLVQSSSFRQALHALFQAVAANWESTGVFIAAFRSGIPALSMRVVTDLGDEQALRDFRTQVRARSRELYGYIHRLSALGWFGRFVQLWNDLEPEGRGRLPSSVWPWYPERGRQLSRRRAAAP